MGRIGYSIPKGRILMIMSLVYLFAFSSLYIQLSGLYGPNGVIPVHNLPSFIAIMLTNFNSKSTVSDRIGLWLLRWLLFRINLSSGVINLMHDSSWWKLKGMHEFYQTQNLPNPLAWYISLAPEWVQKLILVVSFITRIVLPLLFFVPLSGIRKFSFYVQLLQQVVLVILGNYGFLNILVIALCYSLLRNDDFVKPRTRNNLTSVFTSLLSYALIGAVLGSCGYFLNFEIVNGKLQCSIKFTKKQFTWAFNSMLIYLIYTSVAMFIAEFCLSLIQIFNVRNVCSKLYELIRLFLIGALGLAILAGSLFAFSSLDPSVQSKLPAELGLVYRQLELFKIVNSYALDAETLRKVSDNKGRLELILEGAPSADGPWTEFEFYSKPGRLDQVPKIIVPHLPRLDWQMWSITSGNYLNYPWFTNFVYRLLQKQPEVLQLLKPLDPGLNIQFIRGRLFYYQFTDKKNAENWWQRTFQSEYMLPVSLSSTTLQNAVRKSGLTDRDTVRSRQLSPNVISDGLTYLRTFLGQPSNMHSFVTVCFFIMLTRLAFNRASRVVDN